MLYLLLLLLSFLQVFVLSPILEHLLLVTGEDIFELFVFKLKLLHLVPLCGRVTLVVFLLCFDLVFNLAPL